MEKPFHVSGWIDRGPVPKETDGVEYDMGDYETREIAEGVRAEKLRCGWRNVAVIDRRQQP